MPSIREIAKEAGVSIATVSRVINGHDSVNPELRERVMGVIDRCDYTPAVGRRAMNTVALLYAGPFTIGSPYDSACMEGLVTAMRESEFDLAVIDVRRDKSRGESLRKFFNRKGICGAIIRSTATERGLVAEFAEEGVPLVVLGDHFQHPTLTFAYTESRQASAEAVEYLVSLGHRRIAFAACCRDDGDHADRLEAYREVLDQNGLLDEDLICRAPPSRMDGGPVLRRLMSAADRPTAMYIADPLIAAGVVNEAHQMGIHIPEDLSIVGFDDTDIRNLLHPRISSVCQDSEALGRTAFRLLEGLVRGVGVAPALNGRQSAWLEIQDSTGPPPIEAPRIMPSGSRLPAGS